MTGHFSDCTLNTYVPKSVFIVFIYFLISCLGGCYNLKLFSKLYILKVNKIRCDYWPNCCVIIIPLTSNIFLGLKRSSVIFRFDHFSGRSTHRVFLWSLEQLEGLFQTLIGTWGRPLSCWQQVSEVGWQQNSVHQRHLG